MYREETFGLCSIILGFSRKNTQDFTLQKCLQESMNCTNWATSIVIWNQRWAGRTIQALISIRTSWSMVLDMWNSPILVSLPVHSTRRRLKTWNIRSASFVSTDQILIRWQLDQAKDEALVFRNTIDRRTIYRSMRMAEPRYVRTCASCVSRSH